MHKDEIIHLSWDKEELEKEVMYSENDVDIQVCYYYDLHGQYIPEDGPNGKPMDEMHADSVKLVRHVELWKMPGGEPSKVEWHQLLINGENIPIMYVLSYKKHGGVLIIKVVTSSG